MPLALRIARAEADISRPTCVRHMLEPSPFDHAIPLI
jgi:hypothetical protein